jgi:radical SAM-linked protein
MSRRTPDGPPPPPVVQRVRVRYARRGRLRFTSHRDVQRSLERALRRARIAMAFSAGFSPHPRISYAGAAPTGTASEAEYLELALAQRMDPVQLRDALDASLPPGLDIVDVVEARTSGFVDRLEASVWRIDVPGVSVTAAQRAVAQFLAAETVLVERTMKAGKRSFDARGAVVSLLVEHQMANSPQIADTDANLTAAAANPSRCAILRVVVRHGTPSVRPDDVLTALSRCGGLVPLEPPRVFRLAQGPLDPGSETVGDPLEADRAAVDA